MTPRLLPQVVAFALAFALIPQSPSAAQRGVSDDKLTRFFDQMRPADTAPSVITGSRESAAIERSQAASQNASARVVFQSFRDGNWEIYRANGDLGAQQNLSNNGAQDTRPELSFDGQRIAFSSNRDGDYDIYVMNWDGGALQQLTNTPGDDYSPSFGPDGRIAFISTRDGNPEVYVLNGDVSGAERITNTPGFEYGPAYSINGVLSWATGSQSTVLGTAYLRQPEPTGSGELVTTQFGIGSISYLGSPAWSHSGDRLAIDGDLTGDGFNELIVVSVEAPQLGILAASTPFVDMLAGSWLPGDQAMLLGRVEYEDAGDVLRKTASHIERIALTGGPSVRVSQSARDEQPNARWNDAIAPTLRTNSGLVLFSLFPSIGAFPRERIQLRSSDGESGFAFYEARTRVPSGSWSAWKFRAQNAEQLMERLLVPVSTRIDVQVRAVDKAGNRSDLPDSDQPSFTLVIYRYGTELTVFDARGIPLQDAALLVAPSDFPMARSSASGILTAILPENPAQLSLEAAGMQSLSNPRPGGQAISISTLKTYLATDDNAVVNGGFEQSLTGWSLTGPVTRVASMIPEVTHAGDHAIQLGDPIQPTSFAEISQTVLLSTTMHKPVLAMVRGEGFLPHTVTIASALTQTVVYSYVPGVTPLTASTIVTKDLSDWVGQPVTLSISGYSTQSVGTVLFDHISISSWRTPLIAAADSQATGAGGATITITGSNFISTPSVFVGGLEMQTMTWVDESTLRIALPAQLPLGRYDVTVVNPGGVRSTRTQAIVIGRGVFLPVLARES
jgi:hypothetical protein